jgi:cytochrome d ubiquinol oxidase subunit II
MTATGFILALTWLSLTAYALLAGADFGAGTWDLLAGNARDGRERRGLIEHVIGPVWEANHVWLIFVLVLLWTAFPPAFASIASTLWIPLTVAALGIIGRGSAFAFRKTVTETWERRLFGATFAASSVVTPFFLGTAAGAIASGRVPRGIAAGDPVTAWTSPVAILAGLLTVAAGSFLAATYLCGDASRQGSTELADWFRLRALASGAVSGALAVAGLVVVHHEARPLFTGLSGRAFPLVLVSVLAGIAALVLLTVRRYLTARLAAGLAVTGLVWGWGVAQYPHLLPGLDVSAAAAVSSTLDAVVVTSLIGLALLVPSLVLLLRLFQAPMWENSQGDSPAGRAERAH